MDITIYHPITNKPINLYSNEVNELIKQGYNEKDIASRPRIIYKNIFTGIQDIDQEILYHLPFEQLKPLLQIDTYSYQHLYKSKNFWTTYLQIHFPTLYQYITLPDNITNWFFIYHLFSVIENAMTYLFTNKRRHLTGITNKSFKLSYFIKVLNKIGVKHKFNKGGKVYKMRAVEFYGAPKSVSLYIFEQLYTNFDGSGLRLNEKPFVQFLFTLLYERVIVKLFTMERDSVIIYNIIDQEINF